MNKKKEVMLFCEHSLPFAKTIITLCKNFSLILCKNYGKIEEWPMGDSNPQPEI